MRTHSCAAVLPVLACLLGIFAPPAGAQGNLDPFFQPGKIRTLIISGRNNHDWRSTTPFLGKLLTQTGRFDVRVTDEPTSLSLNELRQYHLIIMNYCGPRLGPSSEHALGSAIQAGLGFVVVHGASYPFGEMEVLADHHRRTGIFEQPWPDYFEMIGAKWVKGPPKSGHGKRHVFDVKFVDREHPIAKGMAASFPISDELYHRLKLKKGIHILATAYSDPATGGTGRDEPILWTLRYGKGRVFHTTLGHDLGAMVAPGFVTTFARGAEWAATGKVTLPATMTAEPAKKNPVRVQLVVGGHAYAPSLYGVFDGYSDIAATVVDQPSAYGKQRLRDTDVVVMYDMMQPISNESKANLRSYLESGKGLVVLHHALADYQNWEWWWRDVVGARYVLKGWNDLPQSDYKEGIWMRTKTVARHPVTKGVPPMLIHDEGYAHMWYSPRIKLLVTTEHANSDGKLAWISPYEKARVVAIQLGHGPEAHNHPDFRRLVYNAILWTARRTTDGSSPKEK